MTLGPHARPEVLLAAGLAVAWVAGITILVLTHL